MYVCQGLFLFFINLFPQPDGKTFFCSGNRSSSRMACPRLLDIQRSPLLSSPRSTGIYRCLARLAELFVRPFRTVSAVFPFGSPGFPLPTPFLPLSSLPVGSGQCLSSRPILLSILDIADICDTALNIYVSRFHLMVLFSRLISLMLRPRTGGMRLIPVPDPSPRSACLMFLYCHPDAPDKTQPTLSGSRDEPYLWPSSSAAGAGTPFFSGPP